MSVKRQRCLVATSLWRLQTTRDGLYLSGLVGERHRDTLTPERERASERQRDKRDTAGQQSGDNSTSAGTFPVSDALFPSLNSLFREPREEEKQQRRWRREGRGGGGEAGVKFVQVCTSLRKRHFDSSPHRSNFAASLLLSFFFAIHPRRRSSSSSSPSTPPPSSSSPRCLGASSPTPTKCGVSVLFKPLHRSIWGFLTLAVAAASAGQSSDLLRLF